MLSHFNTMKTSLLVLLIAWVNVCYAQQVSRIIDGDTFEIASGEKIRMIGINAPEISDLHGVEAKQHLSELISGKNVKLVSDTKSNDRDRYSRILRYVFVDGTDINKKMIEDGHAIAYMKFKFDKATEYEETQISAEKKSINTVQTQSKKGAIHLIGQYSIKVYIVSFLLLVLLIMGIYYRLKK